MIQREAREKDNEEEKQKSPPARKKRSRSRKKKKLDGKVSITNVFSLAVAAVVQSRFCCPP